MTLAQASRLDVVIVGAGFSGLYMLHLLRGQGWRARVYEGASDVGGTWFWNRYPGARCDVESLQYSYSFDEDLQQDWNWSERFATQPEILRYINHVAVRFDLRRDIVLDTRITAASWREDSNDWLVETATGEQIVARFVIMATGCLSAAQIPQLPGLQEFRGPVYHTGDWPHEGVDFSGKRVAVIGTGSSAIQAIPPIAQQAASLHVFQRTPNFSVPARNQPLTPEKVADWKARYPEIRNFARTKAPSGTIYEDPIGPALTATPDQRHAEFDRRWQMGGANFMRAFSDVLLDETANDFAAEFVRDRIRETVKDPDTAAALLPYGYPIFAKRICVDTDYYETFNRENVTLVNLRKTPLDTLTASGIRTAGQDYEFDAIVFATGFDAMTGALNRVDIRGTDGRLLRDKWADGPRAYLGLMSAGYPNLFTVTGPGSPSVLSNVMVSIEQHVEWIAACLAHLRDQGVTRIDAKPAAEDAWVRHVGEVAAATLMPKGGSWYMGANIAGKPRVFMPYIGVPAYRARCDEVVALGYEGFHLGAVASAARRA